MLIVVKLKITKFYWIILSLLIKALRVLTGEFLSSFIEHEKLILIPAANTCSLFLSSITNLTLHEQHLMYFLDLDIEKLFPFEMTDYKKKKKHTWQEHCIYNCDPTSSLWQSNDLFIA
jgi:hypothetical protein